MQAIHYLLYVFLFSDWSNMPRVSNDDDYVPKSDKNSQYKPNKNPPPAPFTVDDFPTIELPQYQGAPKNLSVDESREPVALINHFIDFKIIDMLIQHINTNAAYQQQFDTDSYTDCPWYPITRDEMYTYLGK